MTDMPDPTITDDEIVDELLSIPSFGPLLLAMTGTPPREARIINALGQRVKKLEAERQPRRHWWQR